MILVQINKLKSVSDILVSEFVRFREQRSRRNQPSGFVSWSCHRRVWWGKGTVKHVQQRAEHRAQRKSRPHICNARSNLHLRPSKKFDFYGETCTPAAQMFVESEKQAITRKRMLGAQTPWRGQPPVMPHRILWLSTLEGVGIH